MSDIFQRLFLMLLLCVAGGGWLVAQTGTANGCGADSCFAVGDSRANQGGNVTFLSTPKISVDLPTETASARSVYLRILQTAPNSVISTIYPAFGTAALTTFIRTAPPLSTE